MRSSRVDQPPVSGVPVPGATISGVSLTYYSCGRLEGREEGYRQDPGSQYQSIDRLGSRCQHGP